ncbi:MAG: filamentous hemagglutinin N-terminal domain-containing protein, partial [Pseudomonadota bacterium]
MPYSLNATLSRTARNYLISTALATIITICPLACAQAMDPNTLPAGEKVLGGEASFDRSTAGVLNIKQGSDRLLIDWHEGFNIGSKAATHFYQPNSQSLVVNRVVSKSDDPTQILGNLTANGRVVVLDRNGIIFGKSSTVDVGSIIASTGDINTKEFLNGGKTFTLDNITKGSIINSGTITVAEEGLAAFVAPQVRNNGLIIAKMGTVLMGDAKLVTFDLYGDGLIEVVADKNLKDTLIENTGKIDVKSGRILLTAQRVGKVIKSLINMKGISKSDTFKVEDGLIILSESKEKEKETTDISMPETPVAELPVAEIPVAEIPVAEIPVA